MYSREQLDAEEWNLILITVIWLKALESIIQGVAEVAKNAIVREMK